jgi:hypothetical protein
MKITTTAVAVLLASVLMTACAKKEEAPPAEMAPATEAAPAAEMAPAATPDPSTNTEDGSQTSGDKVAPKTNETPPPQN